MNKEDIRKQFLDRYDAIINGGHIPDGTFGKDGKTCDGMVD